MDVKAQAGRYGEQIRQLENQGLEEDRNRIRLAWVGFRKQLEGTKDLTPAVDAYYEEYCK